MLAHRYIRTDFTSQEDFEQNYCLNIPPRFNFAYDIVDEYARISPDKRAMIWTNVAGEEKQFTFADMSRKSNQVANYFRSLGLKKGDPVMLVLKRRYEYWFCALALMKLGCIIIPATQKIYLECIKLGYTEIFINAGCVVSTPTCGPCLGGYMGILAEDEVAVATTNRNFVGRMGHVTSKIYLAGPETAAASAVKGYITDPRSL